MSNVMDKLAKIKSRQEKRSKNTGGKTTGIFHKMKDGENNVRLIGSFFETQTHYIGESNFDGFKGLVVNKEGAPKVVNCGAWDVEKEQWKPGVVDNNDWTILKEAAKYCPICAIRYIASIKRKDEELDESERENFNYIMKKTKPKSNYKWLCIDRDDPNIFHLDDTGKRTEALGIKILSLGNEALTGIDMLFEKLNDISNDDDGVDIVVKKTNNDGKTRWEYKVYEKVVNRKLVESALTDEEKSLQRPDLFKICGKVTAPSAIINFLTQHYKEILDEANIDFSTVEKTIEKTIEAKKEVKEESDDMPDLGDDSTNESEVPPECFKDWEDVDECNVCPVSKKCKAATPTKK